jgi:Domain of unknown function (DU1801)
MAVEEFLATLEHPLESTVEAIRSAILGVDSRITEGIQHNSPCFHFNGWFATLDVKRDDAIVVVFHHEEKVRPSGVSAFRIDDSAGLLRWPTKERAHARFPSMEDFMAKRTAFKSVVTQWIEQMPG